MGDNIEVFTKINKKPSVSYSVLVPNVKGLEAAVTTNLI
jgi:hydroxymethylglutaryl-CoA lyase